MGNRSEPQTVSSLVSINGRVHKLSLKVINEKKHCKFKTWCKGDKSNIENSTDHFCEETKMHWLPLQI